MRIAWCNLRSRPIQSALTILIVAIGISLSLGVLLLSRGARDGIARASQAYDLIVGAKGSPIQLVLNTVFLQDIPVGNVSHDFYSRLAGDRRVDRAIPLGLGDSVSGFRVVGTTREFFSLSPKPGQPPTLQLAGGRLFEKPFEAVLGAAAAEKLGLKPGDTLRSSHGVIQAIEEEDDGHGEFPYLVVGVLKSSHTPGDLGIYVDLKSYWEIHSPKAWKSKSGGGAAEKSFTEGVTAILVKPVSYVALFQLYQEINQGREAQAVFPGQVVAKLFDLLGIGERVLSAVSYVALLMATLTIVISLYSATVERKRGIAVMRALGARRNAIIRIVLWESALVAAGGTMLGLVLGHGLAYALAVFVRSRSAVRVSLDFGPEEIPLVLAVLVLGLLAGILPAIQAYRAEVARDLAA